MDKVDITPAEGLDRERYNVSAELINPNADDSVKRLMKYLSDIYGEYTVSGQFQDAGFSSHEIQAIRAVTGRYPALCGFDFMDYAPSRIKHGAKPNVMDNAIKWWEEQGGIVTFSWHWNAPEPYLPNTNDSPWWSGFYTRAADIDLAKIMDGNDAEGYELLIRDIDAIAVQFKRLQDAKVPVLWRPLHEASGGWFWWGASGPEAYIQLWRLLYDRLTNYHGINNLIWVMNSQADDWYPGDAYVDIIGEDIYPDKHDYSSQLARFTQASEYTAAHKIITLTENGTMPDPDLIYRDGCNWAWFCTWSGEFVVAGAEYSEAYTKKSQLEKLYNHEKIITLDELPDLRTYPIE